MSRKSDLRNSAGDSCCYTWSDSLPLQLCRPHAQYDFTTSPLSLEIPLFRAALSASSSASGLTALTERQVQELVSALFPKQASASPWCCSARRARPESPVRVMCLLGISQKGARMVPGTPVTQHVFLVSVLGIALKR